MLRISSPKDLLPFRPQEDLLPYEEGLRKAVCESKTASRTYRCATGALLDPSCCVPMTAFDAVDGSSAFWRYQIVSRNFKKTKKPHH
jgi:hypothetical protein